MLKQSNQLGKIAALKEELTVTVIPIMCSGIYKTIFGAAVCNAERVIRQYLLSKLAGIDFNRVLLAAIENHTLVWNHPLPHRWREVMKRHGFRIGNARSSVIWIFFLIEKFLRGVLKIFIILLKGIRESFQPSVRPQAGKFSFFMNLGLQNLPQYDDEGKSYDIINWYLQWPDRVHSLSAIYHDIPGAPSVNAYNLPVITDFSVFSLQRFSTLRRFLSWGIKAVAGSLLGLCMGYWWNALLLSEAATAAVIQFKNRTELAEDYLFHNSNWIYRPLWTYEAAKRGSRIIFYFYSTNCEKFQTGTHAPSLPFGWRACTWPLYLVWDEYQADFVRRAVEHAADIRVVGPIWFQASPITAPETDHNSFAIFDVQPVRDSYYTILGLDLEYYIPITTNGFLYDIYSILEKKDCWMMLKRKRDIGKLAHPSYRHLLRQLDKSKGFILLPAELSAVKLIMNCTAVISMPFTSTAILGNVLGKPSVYYDPLQLIDKNDKAAHGITVLSNPEELEEWVCSIIANPRSSKS